MALRGVAVWAPVAYEGPAGELVKGLKFHGATALADEMAALIVAGAPARMLSGALVPVPLHPGRRRNRAFNQTEAIAAAVAARTGLPVADCLVRAGPAARQVGRGRAARLAGPAGSIAVAAPAPRAAPAPPAPAAPRAASAAPATAPRAAPAPPPEAILVDDVVTTGGTLAACAEALRRAGAARVCALAFARTAAR